MKNFIFTILMILIFASCKEKPTSPDREGTAQFIVIDTSGVINKDPSTNIRTLKNTEIIFNCLDYNQVFKFTTNNQGIVLANGLLGSKYTISVNFQISDNMSVSGTKDKNIYNFISGLDTIFVRGIPSSPILINEIYYCGPVNNKYYIYDLFVELYNNSNEVKYLDGMIICRCGYATDETNDYRIGIVDLGNNISGVRITYAFQFPGNSGGNTYPIQPGQLVVVAGDAIDHRKTIPTSIDLSPGNPVFPQNPSVENATTGKSQLWEFYNGMGTDVDVPNVPNVNNILSSTSTTFFVSLTSDAIILSSGKKGLISMGSYYYIDLTTVLDGVQYGTDIKSNRKIDGRIDAGLAGVGLPRYSGESIERYVDPKNPLRRFDSNNSTNDFGINASPTPGFQGNPK